MSWLICSDLWADFVFNFLVLFGLVFVSFSVVGKNRLNSIFLAIMQLKVVFFFLWICLLNLIWEYLFTWKYSLFICSFFKLVGVVD